jgi:hypothetical protein
MGMLQKNKIFDVNSEKFNDYFKFNDLHNYEKIYLTEKLDLIKGEKVTIIGFKDKTISKLLKNKGFLEINYIDDNTSSFVAISKIKSSDVLIFKDNYEVIDSLNLQDSINSYSKVIVSNDFNILISLGLIDPVIKEMNIVIDKYGIISKISA